MTTEPFTDDEITQIIYLLGYALGTMLRESESDENKIRMAQIRENLTPKIAALRKGEK